MTPTSDERREVAERLRVYSHDFDFGDADPFWYVAKAAFGDVDAHTYHSVFARLADLIDPCPSMADEQMCKLRRRSTALASMTRIASDMSGWAGELADSCERMSRARIADDVRRFADRIRQEVRDALN